MISNDTIVHEYENHNKQNTINQTQKKQCVWINKTPRLMRRKKSSVRFAFASKQHQCEGKHKDGNCEKPQKLITR